MLKNYGSLLSLVRCWVNPSKILDTVQSNTSSSTAPNPTSKPHKYYRPSARIAWPPRVESIEMLGEVKDTNGRNTPRDLGRSVTLDGSISICSQTHSVKSKR